MQAVEDFIKNHDSVGPDDIDALLDAADLTRRLMESRDYSGMRTLIAFTVDKGLFEAFTWIVSILQEGFEKTDDFGMDGFSCRLGNAIPDYDEFLARLQVDLNAIDHEIKVLPDENGETRAFFNVFTYRTMYDNVFLVSSEQFDTKDNDCIQYELFFARR